MTSAYNGRIYGGQQEEGGKFKVVWPGSIYAVDSWVILANSPNKEAGAEFIAFASQPEHQSKLPHLIAYGVTNREAAAEIDPRDPPGPADRAGQPATVSIELDTEFWVENIETLTERFNGWAAQ